ncbi:MAG: hypothetical protein IJZ17_01990 [Muribaculaceae bacterium]|nr:hypothetical protein [Muribaculaceae bacterium]
MDDHNDYFLNNDLETTQQPDNTIRFDGEKLDADSSDSILPHDGTVRCRFRKIAIWSIAILIVGVAVFVWLRYFNPYVIDAQCHGYVTSIERRGILFKTWEATILSESVSITDTTSKTTKVINLSVVDDDVANRLGDYQATSEPVTVVFQRYWGTLPWRGASTLVATDIK